MSSTNAKDDDGVLNELGEFLREQEDAMAAAAEADPFGPLSDGEQDALTATLLSRLGVAPDAAETPRQIEDAKPTVSNVVSLPRPAQRAWPAVAAALSVAAAALFVFWPRSEQGELPAYALHLPAPDASHRAADRPSEPDDAAPRRYVLGRELEVLLRPQTRVEQAVEAHAYVEREQGKLERLVIEPASVSGGTLIFRVPTGDGTALAAPMHVRLHFVLSAHGADIPALSAISSLPKDAQHLVFAFELLPESALDTP